MEVEEFQFLNAQDKEIKDFGLWIVVDIEEEIM